MAGRWLTVLGLLAAVLALGALALRPIPEPEPSAVRLLGLAPEDIHLIRLQRRGQADVELERQGKHWRVSTPFAAEADVERVQALLRIVDVASTLSFDAVDEELPRFGLNPPRARLTLNDRVLEFGDPHPLDGRRYLRLGDRVHLATDRHYHLLITEASLFARGAPGDVQD